VTVVVHALQYLLDAGLVLLVGGADEEVVGALQPRHQRLEALGIAIRQLLRLQSLRARRVGDGLAVLVGAGQEEHVLPALAHVAREHVGGDRRVGVTQVRLGVDVVDRGGYVKGHIGEVPRYTKAILRPPRRSGPWRCQARFSWPSAISAW
jgi:hypothetical protein